MKKLSFILVVIIISASISGCSFFNKNNPQGTVPNNPNQGQTTKNGEANQTEDKNAQQVEDKELTEKIKKEKGVRNAMVYTQSGTAVAVIIGENNSSKESINRLANKYAQELKAKYKNNKVTVQALAGGKDWININLD